MAEDMRPGLAVWWWRRVTSSLEHPYRGRILKVGPARISVEVEDPAAGNRLVVRHVQRERLQRVERYCTCAPGQRHSTFSELHDWGTFTRFLEIDEDLWASRHVDVFEDGRMLGYDRHHWRDGFGMLADLRMNRNSRLRPWGEVREIPTSEFDAVWARAGTGELRARQLESSAAASWGATPIWLRGRGWRPPALA